MPSERPLISTHIRFHELVNSIEKHLIKAGADSDVARILAANCAGCERDGTLSHGVFRVRGYLESLRNGHVDGRAKSHVTRVAPGFVRIDAGNGFAQPALNAGRDEALDAAQTTGCAIVAIRYSHHFSALWPDIEPFAQAGYLVLTAVTGGAPSVAPRGVGTPVFGTNPIAFGFPVENSYPLIADFATSTMSHGDLQLTAQRNEAVPAATGVGQNGRETTDPQEILTDGALLPFGGHKGALLSLLVEVLGSALTGGAFSYETEAERPEGSVTSRTGQFLLIVDPDRDLPAGSRDFPTRISQLLRMLRQQGMDRLPGDRRHLTRLQSEEKGIPVTDTIRALLNDDI